MRRGDIVTAAFQGDYGKARPAIVIQGDLFADSESVLLCQLTTDASYAPTRRTPVEPTEANGLKATSQIMVEKIFALRRDKCGRVIGRLDDSAMERLNGALALMIGLIE